MARIVYEEAPMSSLGKARYNRAKFPSSIVARRRKFVVKGIDKLIVRPGSTCSPANLVFKKPEAGAGERIYEVEVKMNREGTAKTFTAKMVYSPAKIQKSVCPYGELWQKESRILQKILSDATERAKVNLEQSQEETKQRDYDTVMGEYQHLLDQKYSGGLDQQQRQKLYALKQEMDKFGKERFRRISNSPEYRDFKEALKVLQEFNKSVSAQTQSISARNDRRRR
jgi:hypothetical protein